MMSTGMIRTLGRSIKYGVRKSQIRARWRGFDFSKSPVVFGNAYAKSGSHLLLQVLQGMEQTAPFWPLHGIPIRTITRDGRHRSEKEIIGDLDKLHAGEIAWGYLNATRSILDVLSRPNWATYMIIRDPRDVLISHIFYATDIYTKHSLHKTYQELPDMAARLLVEIQGTQDYPYLPNVDKRFRRKLGFLDNPHIHIVRFEDLVYYPEKSINQMLNHLDRFEIQLSYNRNDAIELILKYIQPKKSPTFRRGIPGEWEEHFNSEHRHMFKELAGDILIEMDYEKSYDW